MPSPTTQADLTIRCVLVAIGLALLAVTGCGRPEKTPPASQQADARGGSESSASKQGHDAVAQARKKSQRQHEGTDSHLATVPRNAWSEVFFKAPLEILAEKSPNAPPVAVTTPPAKSAGEAPARAAVDLLPEPSPGEAEEWVVLLSGEDLSTEAKTIRSSLTDKLRSVGKYSGNYKELRIDAATLAVLAGIAADHPDPPSWRAHSKYIRDVSAEIVKSAAANGDKYYKPTRVAFDKLDALLSGSKPPNVEEAAEKVRFSELVSRVPLMYRMERAFNYLKLNVNTAAIFKKESAKVSHEAAMIAALARAIATPGYDDADLDDYRAFARELQQSGLAVADAVQNDDFAAFTAALDRGSKACVNCHMEFKNN
ncbi:MAG TPA: hypothetical protein VL475_09130 [Planctomycetaceae bacterium]|nr:hypothetical protein [Planctomycetaceae bacterium]